MFVILYRWRVNPNFERQFIESWSARTAYLLSKYDTLGSRLHRGGDGIWYGYAQWKSAEQRERAFASESQQILQIQEKMHEAIEESFPEILMEIIADYFISPENI